MPKYSSGTLVTEFGFFAPGYSTVVLEDLPNSRHSGRRLGAMVSVSRTIHDVSSYALSNVAFDLLSWPASPDWKMVVLGGTIWLGNLTYSTDPTIQLGHNSLANAILNSFVPPYNLKYCKGLLNADYHVSFNRGILVTSAESPIKTQFNASTVSTVAGSFSTTVWGYILPDLEVSTS